MHTAHFSGNWGGLSAQTPLPPPWTEFLTHACKNITFLQLLLRAVMKPQELCMASRYPVKHILYLRIMHANKSRPQLCSDSVFRVRVQFWGTELRLPSTCALLFIMHIHQKRTTIMCICNNTAYSRIHIIIKNTHYYTCCTY